ncbi:threonine--tRNA ligase [Candidatus Saccharibacteria bacterium]|nr:threonine--tRNA ligase [Candidatus Saccharibacteria bacterium]
MSDQNQPDKLYAMRHSLAHIMATAIKRLWPDAKFGVGPVVENGFYYDIDLGADKISEDDFKKIEAEMQAIIRANDVFEQFEKPVDEAIAWAQNAQQPYKVELLNDLKRAGTTVAKDLSTDELGTIASGDAQVENVSFYKNGEFTDLCRGPHVESTGKVGAFKLQRIGGVYWRGKEGNPQMQRIYGVAFATPKELRQHLDMLEEARKRDHRKLGQELDLFTFSPLVGPGLPLFTPRGTVIRQQLTNFAESLRLASGFDRVSIPHITKTELYKVSGHWDKFGEQLFLVESQVTSDAFALKPMNCPHHHQIYAFQPKSYRDLPVRYFETTTVYRDEKTGELGGLSRVRSITQDDSHVYCRADQLEAEVGSLAADVKSLYLTLGMELHARLSYRDESDKYLGEQALWDESQTLIKSLAEKNDLSYFEAAGEAAFYGPKIDFMATDALGRDHQVATIQLDFVIPERFGLDYTTEDGSKQQPVVIHCALLGSIERFMSVYIEHTAGKFPVWVAPEQVWIITLNQEDTTVDYAYGVLKQAKSLGLRVTIDNASESVGKKIRSAELYKIPYTIVIGQKEIESGRVTPRIRKDMEVHEGSSTLGLDEFFKTVANEAKSRVLKTSL